MQDARIGDLAFDRGGQSRSGAFATSTASARSCGSRRPTATGSRSSPWPYGTVVYDLDVSPDGSRMVASFGDISGKQEVRVLRRGGARHGRTTTPVAHSTSGSAVPNNFVFSPDGRSLYGSSYFTGVSNIFRYDLESRKLDAVTNTDTGFFRPVPLGDEQLIVFRYTGEGFVPARIAPQPLEDISADHVPRPSACRGAPGHQNLERRVSGRRSRLDTLPQRTGIYRLAGGLRRDSFYPVVQGYKDTAAVGMRLNFSDPLQLNRASVTASYSPAGDLPPESGCTSRPSTSATTGAAAPTGTAPTSTTSSGRPRPAARVCLSASAARPR